MTLVMNTACDKPHTSLLHPASRHGTSDSQLPLTQGLRKPHTSRLIELLKAVEVAHETQQAADTRHGTSNSQRLVAHDHVLVQRQREHRGADIRNTHRNFKLPERAGATGVFNEDALVGPVGSWNSEYRRTLEHFVQDGSAFFQASILPVQRIAVEPIE
jgi:hypothetical protein